METEQKHLVITGRVQGVGFRHFTRKNAMELKVTGWVRNREDGSVEAMLQGSPDRIAQLIDRLKTGPAIANVESMEAENRNPVDAFRSFEVVQ